MLFIIHNIRKLQHLVGWSCRKRQLTKSTHCFICEQWGWGSPHPREQGPFRIDEILMCCLGSAGENQTSHVFQQSKEIMSIGMAEVADSAHESNGNCTCSKDSPGNTLFIVLLGTADLAVLFASHVHGGAMFKLTPQAHKA